MGFYTAHLHKFNFPTSNLFCDFIPAFYLSIFKWTLYCCFPGPRSLFDVLKSVVSLDNSQILANFSAEVHQIQGCFMITTISCATQGRSVFECQRRLAEFLKDRIPPFIHTHYPWKLSNVYGLLVLFLLKSMWPNGLIFIKPVYIQCSKYAVPFSLLVAC